MKKVAIRFNHDTLCEDIIKKLDVPEKIIRYLKEPKTFYIHIERSEQFELFADKVEKETGHRPTWTAAYSVDVDDPPAQVSA